MKRTKPEFLSTTEAAKVLGMARGEFTAKIVGKRLLPFFQPPGCRKIRIKREDLDAFVAKHTVRARS